MYYYFGASTIAPQIVEVFKDTNDATSAGNMVLSLIRTIGVFIAVGTLMILGIKYIMGSTEQKASYKKSMIPYVVGAILLFAAVNITTFIAEGFGLDDVSQSGESGESGESGDGHYDFTERKCDNCGEQVTPTFDIDRHTYVCPRCGQPM